MKWFKCSSCEEEFRVISDNKEEVLYCPFCGHDGFEDDEDDSEDYD